MNTAIVDSQNFPLDVLSPSISDVPKSVSRQHILTLEASMRAFNYEHNLAEPECPLTHHFAPGVYGREILLPKDSLVVGKIHKHAHLNMIMKGHVSVATEDGVHEYKGPLVLVSLPGTKRVVYAHEDTVWVTVHLTNSQDLQVIEEEIIAKTYEEYDILENVLAQKLIATVAQKEIAICLG